jgi:putative hydrolase of the HAD superfamily
MTGPLIVMDLGGVLVRTVAHAQFAALAAMTGISLDRWSAAANGLIGDLESGWMSFSSFASDLARRAGAPWLPLADIESAWGLVIDRLDEKMAEIAARLSSENRLLFASNTDPVHFAKVRRLLTADSIDAPFVVSYEIGYRKPSEGFFRAVAAADPRVRAGAVFIDDLTVNVEAALGSGLNGYHHRDTASTISYLLTLEAAT